MKADCTIVVPTLNEEACIGQLFASVRAQTLPAAAVIVVDNNNTDSTSQMAVDFGAIVVVEAGKGVSRARKAGFAAATTGIIISTDADTVLIPTYIERVQQYFGAHPETVAVFGPAHLVGGPWFFRLLSWTAFSLFLRASIFTGKPNLNGFNFACRADAYRKVGGFNENVITAEDLDLGLRLMTVGKIAYVPGLLVHTSSRRLVGMGGWHFVAHHALNYWRTLRGQKGSSDFKPYR